MHKTWICIHGNTYKEYQRDSFKQTHTHTHTHTHIYIYNDRSKSYACALITAYLMVEAKLCQECGKFALAYVLIGWRVFQLLKDLILLWIQTFTSLRPFAILVLKNQVCPTIYHSWAEKNWWIHVFYKHNDYSKPHIYMYIYMWWGVVCTTAYCVLIIVIENGYDEPSSHPERGCFHFK